ncbi:triadin-like isoform X5 [Cyprinus carpio]|uniref:Triadin-like isoform X5 n=1 Tax=Cyprinus carpio TaxID=7962 RepID=A0A9Q9Z8M9_CYPCA|nr:triadin-like isoform X5 [Cyprinus carpio]
MMMMTNKMTYTSIAVGIIADAGVTVADAEVQETGEESILLKADGDSKLLTTIEESDDAVADLADSQDGLSATDIPFDDLDNKITKELADDHGGVSEDSLKDETGAGMIEADSEKDITSEGEGVIEEPELADDVADKEEQEEEGKEEGEEQIRGEDDDGAAADDDIIVTAPVVSSEPGGDETTVVADEDDGSSPETDITTLKEEEKDEKDESAEEVEIAEKAPEPEPVPKVAAEEVKEKEAEEPVAEAEKEAEPDEVKKREAETKRKEPLLKQRKEKESPVRTRLEKAKKAPKAKTAAVNIPKKKISQASEDVELSAAPAPVQDLPICRPTPVYCPTPPGWYVHHIVTSSPLPPSAIPESEVPILTTQQAPTVLKEPEAAMAKPKQAHKKKEPKEKAKVAPTKKEPTVTKAKVKLSVAKKEPTAVKEKSKRTERMITKEKAKPTSNKKEEKAVKEVKPRAEVKKKAAPTLKANQAIKEVVAEAPAPAPTKDLKAEENVTEGKRPGKIPYFQCVLMSSKSSQYPLRPMSPAMSPAVNPTMMRAMMEQRAALLQQKAHAAGQ